jgi:uncharacterized protein (DUF58 family)
MHLPSSLQKRFFRWALRGRVPEQAPIILGHKRVFVLPTRAGLVFATALLLMLVGNINYNLSLGYVLVFLLAGLGIVAILHSFRNLAHLEISPGRADPVFAGDKARFGVILANSRATSRSAIRLNLPGEAVVEIDLPPNANTGVRLETNTSQRGWLPLPRIRLATNFPLGLVLAWAYAAPKLSCLVYPTPANSAPPLPLGSSDKGEGMRNGAGMDDFAGLRGHQAADPLRHIAWKAAAHLDDGLLMTKLFVGGASTALIFDWDTLPAGMGTEARLSLLTRWICDAHSAGYAWQLRLPGIRHKSGSGSAHLHICLADLALYGD